MINLIDFFVRRYVLTISDFAAIVLFGIVAATRIGVDLLPNFELSFVTVTTTYPGAGSEEVAKQIAEPIEGALSTLPGINSLSSTSFEGFAVVVFEFAADVDADQAAWTYRSGSTRFLARCRMTRARSRFKSSTRTTSLF